MSKSNYGQEITQNEWQIGFQNFLRLILLSMGTGLGTALLWFSLFAPRDSFAAVNLYWYSWLYCRVPFGCSTTAIYNQQVLQPTIDRLGGVSRASTNVFALMTIASAIAYRSYFVKRGAKLTEERYLRGAKLLKPEVLKAEIEQKHSEKPFDLKLGREAVRIPELLTYRNASFAGAAGTGKTQAINSMLRQLGGMKNQKVFILDLNGQYYSRFGRPQDKILSLYDTRTDAWEFWQENASPEFFAEALIELDQKDKFFAPAGRALLTDLIRRNESIDGLWRDLTLKPDKLLDRVEGGISPSLLGAPDQAAGVQATASLQLNFLRHLNHWSDGRPFKITEWATSPSDDWVFLIVRDQDLAASKPLLRLWFDLATLGVLQREEELAARGYYPHLWLIADELPGLGKLPTLGKLLSQGRKYKASVVCGYQTSGQIDDLYGHDGAKEIFQGLQTKVNFRSSDPDTSKRGSLEMGEQDVEETSSNVQFGAVASNDRNSLNRATKTRPVVMPSQLQNLPDLHAYIKICEFNPTLIHLDYHPYPVVNQPTSCEIPKDTPIPVAIASSPKPMKQQPQPQPQPQLASQQSNSDEEPDYDFDPEDPANFLKF